MRFFILTIISLTFFISATITNVEASVEEVDGVLCVNGDLNMPIWDGGSGVVSFFDVSSSYIFSDSSESLIIKVNEGWYSRNGTIEMRDDNPQTLMQNKRTNELYINGLKQTRKSFNDAFYLVKMHAISVSKK